MNLSEKVSIEMELSTLSTLVAGLYVMYTNIDVNAVPTSLFIEIAERLVPYLEEWDYSKISFEEWVRTSLIIAPINFFAEEELEEFRKNEIHLERKLGNAILIATANMECIK